MQQIGNYLILQDQLIGRGTNSVVLRCRDSEKSEKVCVKVLQIADQQQKSQIIQILSVLKQPNDNVIKIYDAIPSNNEIYIFMEQCDGNLSQQLIDRKKYWFRNDEIYDFLSQIVNGYMYLKSLNIIHRNIIPKNILYKDLFDNRVLYKISDFEVGKITKNYSQMSMAGTPLYQAPEVFYQQQYIDDKCDVFSLGLILYQLCYQQPVDEIRNRTDLQNFHERIRNYGYKCPPNNQVDRGLLDLIEQMIVYNPQQRISWDDLARHPTLQKKFLLLDNYFIDFNKSLGSGAQGATFQAFNLISKQQYCAKRIKNDQIEGMREIEIYQTIKNSMIKNENIIGIEEIKYVGNEAYLILEKCSENIEQFCKNKQFNFTEEEIIDIIKQITNGYIFLKSLNIIHRDLKPANILVSYQNQKPILKIIDYGVGKILSNNTILATTQAGTPSFAAPEVLIGNGNYDHSCDIFSLGVMCYELVHKKPLIYANSMDDLLRKLDALRTNPAKCQVQLQQKLSQTIERMLRYYPRDRITWEELRDMFKSKIKIISVSEPIKQESNIYEPQIDLFKPQITPASPSIRQTPYPAPNPTNPAQIPNQIQPATTYDKPTSFNSPTVQQPPQFNVKFNPVLPKADTQFQNQNQNLPFSPPTKEEPPKNGQLQMVPRKTLQSQPQQQPQPQNQLQPQQPQNQPQFKQFSDQKFQFPNNNFQNAKFAQFPTQPNSERKFPFNGPKFPNPHFPTTQSNDNPPNNKLMSQTSFNLKPQPIDYMYLKNLIELVKRHFNLIEQFQQDKQNTHFIALTYLILVLRIQCITDLIKLIDKNQIFIDKKPYTLSDSLSDEQKYDLEIEKQECLELKNMKRKILDTQRDSLIKEILQAESKELNPSFANILQIYQKYFKNLSNFLKDNQKLGFAALSLYCLLEDYPLTLNSNKSAIQLMTRQKTDPEKQEYYIRRIDKFNK